VEYSRDENKSDLAEWFDRILTLPGNPSSNLTLVSEIEIRSVFLDESRKLPQIQQYDLTVRVVV
jgi:hypothetical protein